MKPLPLSVSVHLQTLGRGGLGAANSHRGDQIWSPGRSPGGAIRWSPLVRERLGLGGWDARLRHGAMRDGLQAPGSTKSASRGVMCKFWGAQMGPPLASQVRSNGFPAGSAAVGASPFSPPTPNGGRRGGREKVTPLNQGENKFWGRGGWGQQGGNVSIRSGPPGAAREVQSAAARSRGSASGWGAGTPGPGMAR